jgi:hypothetical protein
MLKMPRVRIPILIVGGIVWMGCGNATSTPSVPSGGGGSNTSPTGSSSGGGGSTGGGVAGAGDNSLDSGNATPVDQDAAGGRASGSVGAGGPIDGGPGDSAGAGPSRTGPTQRLIYAGTNTSVEVYDIDNGHRKLKSIMVPGSAGMLRGICANSLTHAMVLFFQPTTTTGRVIAMDLLTDKEIWTKDLPTGADRGEISNDGTKLYVPGGEYSNTPVEYVLDAATGNPITQLTITKFAHDTDIGLSGKYAYLETKSSPIMSLVDIASDKIIRNLTFGDIPGPNVVDSNDTYVYANVFRFFGFEMVNVATGMVAARVPITGGTAPATAAALMNHSIALKPDETELWEGSEYSPDMFVFDTTVMPPKQTRRITVGGTTKIIHWITFSIDGAYVYPSPDHESGIPIQVYDSKTYMPVATIGYSDDLLEIDFSGGKVKTVGSQYGIGRKTPAP